MAVYMKLLGTALVLLGIAGSVSCWQAASDDEAYFKALRGLSKYPTNVLYQTEFKMAEPRHMLLLGGAASAGPIGVVLGSLCLAMGALLTRRD
jgi:hypothetical protein